ncbi:MAG: alkaline phosphatase family protein [Myxococcota bacterium]
MVGKGSEPLSLHSTFGRPDYAGACFVNIPRSLRWWMTGEGEPALPRGVVEGFEGPWQRVVCLFVDALGWRFIEPRLTTHPMLRTVVESGRAVRMTAQFPSTTAAHVTAFHTGLTPVQSGVYEWNYVEPELDALICPLPMIFARGHAPLISVGADPKKLFAWRSIYGDLANHGIASTLYLERSIYDSLYSRRIGKGATRLPYRSFAECLINMGDQLRTSDGPTYISAYTDPVDVICHRYGPGAHQTAAVIDSLLDQLDRHLLQRLRGSCPRTLLLITADHGQVDVSPDTTITLNTDPRFAGLVEMIETTATGELKAPVGSPRDMFLHIKPERFDEAMELLTTQLDGVADVVPSAALLDAGYFGLEEPSDLFLGRLANLAILPYEGEAVWWFEKGNFKQTFYGHHGGLTPGELEIPLLMLELS